MRTVTFFIFLLVSSIFGFSQTLYDWNTTYSSLAYPYSIAIPKSFVKTTATGRHIDSKFVDDYGSSILVNVTERVPEERGITAHDYSKEMLLESYRAATPNVKITRAEKIYVDHQKAFLIECSGGVSASLMQMECYIYYKEFANVLTATAPIVSFGDYRGLFETAIKSMEFR
ncbi:MAG: hypothetical protein U0176_14870 [Bacteroidia bacterium]